MGEEGAEGGTQEGTQEDMETTLGNPQRTAEINEQAHSANSRAQAEHVKANCTALRPASAGRHTSPAAQNYYRKHGRLWCPLRKAV